MKPDSAFSDLVGLVYQGPLEERPWSGFLGALRHAMGAVVTTLVLRPADTDGAGLILTEGGSGDALALYREGLFMADPFAALPPGKVVALHEIIPLAELEQTELYKLCMAPGGMHDSLGADVEVDGIVEAQLRVSRARGARSFGKRETQLCTLLLPHLERAVRIYMRLHRVESERALYAGAISQLAVGTVILDARGAVSATNTLADGILAARDGLWVAEGVLRVQNPREAAELRRILGELAESQRAGQPALAQALRISRPSGRADLGLVLRPLPATDESQGVAGIAVFVSDPEERSDAPVQVLVKLFGFTPTEALVAIQLANGLNIDDAAAELGMTRNTARAHLRSVFNKTGISRQPALVRLILKSVASLA
ncbi:MAG: helix-turn-helix transcriptional regulator [Gammaproteobacteria bacterium]|nr:helix-turn-helix transcriptional regulator [Gammaproteobacteria bacterium]